MNNLNGMRCYLSGAIEFGAGDWRAELTPFLKSLGVTVFDPTNKKVLGFDESLEDVNRRKTLKSTANYDQVSREMRRIRCIDLRMVDLSDFVIVNLDMDTYTTGTWEEVTLANRQKKPLIFRIQQGKGRAPDWLFGMIDHEMIFDTWFEVKQQLLFGSLDSRWVVFNLDGS